MGFKQMLQRQWPIAIAIVVVLSGCRINGERLRGNTILGIRFPIQNKEQELVSLTSDRVASRAFLPFTVHTVTNTVVVPDTLWSNLENLRYSWCQQPPATVSVTSSDTDYRIILKCEQADEDPTYFVHPSNLPTPLQSLIKLLPSTSERLLPK